MQAQWQPNPSPPADYNGPSFRRAEFLAASRRDEDHLYWHIFCIRDNGALERLPGEFEQDWNAGESVEFPILWADSVISQAG